jgi:hypothetical protein
VILVICVAPLFRNAVTHAIERIPAGRAQVSGSARDIVAQP